MLPLPSIPTASTVAALAAALPTIALPTIALPAVVGCGHTRQSASDAAADRPGGAPNEQDAAAPDPPSDQPAEEPGEHQISVLAFSRTAGFRHTSIEPAVEALRALSSGRGWSFEHTEDPARFADGELDRFDVIVFLLTTGDVLDDAQQGALERWLQGGRGWVGIHSASDTEYDWAWYGGLVGAYFAAHPAIQRATVRVESRDHPATAHLPSAWEREDEWYDFRANPRRQVEVLLTVDESTYRGGGMGADHPVAWHHDHGGGRSFYTALGHTEASWSEAAFLEHVAGGIAWAAAPARARR